MPRDYHVVDVFTTEPLEGNALAVFPDGSGLSDSFMQKIARELNLSETVFVFPSTSPEFAARLRIFTPFREIIFAGHPTVGTSFVLLEESIVPKGSANFVLEELVGPVPVRVEAGEQPLIWLTTPAIQDGPTFDRALAAEILGLQTSDLLDISPQVLSAGNPNVYIALKNPQTVDRAWLEMTGLQRLKGSYPDALCVFVFAPISSGAYSRMFAPEHGIAEDPATGSATGPLAAYMMRHELVSGAAGTRFVSEQGTKMGRRSFLHVNICGENGSEAIEVGGYVTPIARGVMQL